MFKPPLDEYVRDLYFRRRLISTALNNCQGGYRLATGFLFIIRRTPESTPVSLPLPVVHLHKSALDHLGVHRHEPDIGKRDTGRESRAGVIGLFLATLQQLNHNRFGLSYCTTSRVKVHDGLPVSKSLFVSHRRAYLGPGMETITWHGAGIFRTRSMTVSVSGVLRRKEKKIYEAI